MEKKVDTNEGAHRGRNVWQEVLLSSFIQHAQEALARLTEFTVQALRQAPRTSSGETR
jgi:hypothetical protein